MQPHRGAARRRLTLALAATAAAGALPASAFAEAPSERAAAFSAGAERVALAADPTPTAPDCMRDTTQEDVVPVNADGLGGMGIYCQSGGAKNKLVITDRPDHGGIDTYVDSLSVHYEPNKGFTGDDKISYKVVNALGESPVYTTTFRVGGAGANEGPSCYVGHTSDGSEARARAGATRSIPVSCYDHDGDAMTVTAGAIEHGTASVTSQDVTEHGYTYTAYTLNYAVDAGATAGTVVTAAVTATETATGRSATVHPKFVITAADANLAPSCGAFVDYDPATGTGSPVQAEPGDPTSVGYCTDEDGDSMTAVLPSPGMSARSQSSHLTVLWTVPADQAAGDVDLPFSANDGRVTAPDAPGKVRVIAPQASPVCAAVDQSTSKDTPVAFTVACSDAEGPVSYAYAVSNDDAHHGQIARHGDLDIERVEGGGLSFTYRPDAGFTGTDGFGVESGDRYDEGERAAVRLTVTAPSVQGPPSAGTGTGTPQTPAGLTPQQLAQAIQQAGQQLVSATAAFMTQQLARSARAVDPKTGVVGLGTVGAKQLPNGGTIVVGATAPSKALRGAAARKKAKATSIGRVKVTLAKGQQKAVKLKLSAKGRKVLAKKKKLKVTVTMTLTDALSKQSTTVTKTVTLKAKKAKKAKKKK